jgi:crossover junction endodeoxyribonuclease RuvC
MPISQFSNDLVIGLDPGTNRLGYALLSGTKNQPKIVDCGIIETLKGFLPEIRLLEIANDLEIILNKHKPSRAVVEDLFFFKNQKTIIGVAQSRGVVLMKLAQHNCQITSLTPLQIKQRLTGQGRADKKVLQIAVAKLLKMGEILKPDDVMDALGMAWLGL